MFPGKGTLRKTLSCKSCNAGNILEQLMLVIEGHKRRKSQKTNPMQVQQRPQQILLKHPLQVIRSVTNPQNDDKAHLHQSSGTKVF